MNLQIRLLAEQAGMLFDERDRPLWVALDQVDKAIFLNKFAELIVRECALALDETIAPTSHPFNSVGWKLKEHFGIKDDEPT